MAGSMKGSAARLGKVNESLIAAATSTLRSSSQNRSSHQLCVPSRHFQNQGCPRSSTSSWTAPIAVERCR